MERSRRAANLLIIRSTGSGALSTSLGHPDFAAPATYRAVLLLATSEATKNFAMLSHSPRSVHEARLDSPEQPSFLTARKGGPLARARANMTSSRDMGLLVKCCRNAQRDQEDQESR